MLQLRSNDFEAYPPLKLEMPAHHFPLWFTLYLILSIILYMIKCTHKFIHAKNCVAKDQVS
jgi:hypothetical protein